MGKVMKIGLVCPYNITKGGGVQECVKAIQAGLIARGHQAYIITPRPAGEMDPPRGVIYLGNGTDFSSLATTTQLSASITTEEIDHVLQHEKFNVLHFHEPWVPMLSRQILSRSRSVNVATFHAKLPETMMVKTLSSVITPYTKSVLKYIHEYTAVSDAAKEYLASLTDEQIHIIPNGIDLSNYSAPRVRPKNSPKQILFVGRLEKRKGVAYLLRAFALVSEGRDDVELLIGGDGTDREKLELLARDLGISEKVRFLGYLSDAEKHRLLRSADVFCSPALYGESFGIVLLEAMASGAATVAGNNPGYSTVMRGIGAISLVNPKRPKEFSARLKLFLDEPELQLLWRKWARESVQQYDYDKVIDAYEALYKDAVKKHQ